MSFNKICEQCGRVLYIEDQICDKCGFDFGSSLRISPKCPFCEKELHLHDFFLLELDKKGHKRIKGFLGEFGTYHLRMWHCPFCGKILGFSDAIRGA